MSLLAALLCSVALAGQTAFTTRAGPRDQAFHYAWTDAAGVPHTVDFSLPAATVARDLGQPLRLPLKQLASAQVAAVRAYAEATPGPRVEARAGAGGTVSITVEGKDAARVRAALAGAEAAREEGRERYLAAQGWTEDRRGRLRPDHARLAAEYADDVRPVAAALGLPALTPRDGAALALSFVQSMKYERRRRGGDAGFRRPLSVLAADTGDCDGKATLYAALLRAGYPDLPLTITYIPNHAFVGVGLEPERGERSFRHDGVRYVLAEPVGPDLASLGDGSGRTRRHAALGTLEAVVVP